MSESIRTTPRQTFALLIPVLAALAGSSAFRPAGAWAQNEPAAAAKPAAPAQPDSAEQRRRVQLLKDFNHYVRIQREDLAKSLGEQLLALKLPPKDFSILVENSGELERFEGALTLAIKTPGTEPIAAALLKTYERGKLDRARDPEEVKRNIGFLAGLQRARLLGRERLMVAGEYAMPQLVEAMLQRQDPALSAEAQKLIVDMGQQSVAPLCASLEKLDPSAQERAADILGMIKHETSLPYLAELRDTTKSPAVRQAAERAIARIGGPRTGLDSADLYRLLAEGYYSEQVNLTSFPGEDYQLLWFYEPQVGLHMRAIRTEVFHEAMTMRLAEHALLLKPIEGNPSLPLWLAANFSRETDTPTVGGQKYENPVYPSTKRDAMYYAVASGPNASQSVLSRAIRTKDTPLARQAIAAIEKTAGGATLWADVDGTRPLVDALRYPNRRVQYEAALAMAKTQPAAPFDGSDRVVPLLASAIRDATARFAAVIADDQEMAKTLRGILEKEGYKVLPTGRSLDELRGPIGDTPGLDLILVRARGPEQTAALINEVKSSPRMLATPILALTTAQGHIDLSRDFDRDPMVAVRPVGLTEEQIGQAAKQLVEVASGGPISADEGRAYATRSIAALRDLAVSGNEVFNAGDAAQPLVAALGEYQGAQKLDVAEVLSRIDQKRTHVALADSALSAAGPERVALLGKSADAAKRFGNRLEPRQIERVIEVATGGSAEEATAAAALMGSLKLSNANLIPLITGQAMDAQPRPAAQPRGSTPPERGTGASAGIR